MRAALLFLALLAAPAVAQAPADRAAAAAAQIADAAEALEDLRGGADRLAQLGRIVQGYEAGLAAQREAARDLALRRDVLAAEMAREEERLSAVLGALHQVVRTPGPLLMIHPQGPEGAARAAQALSGVVPQLQAEADGLRALMIELDILASEQARAESVLREGLEGVRRARIALSATLEGRSAPDAPGDADLLARLRGDADTLEGFARLLARQARAAGEAADFDDARGRLTLPLPGAIVAPFGTRAPDGAVQQGVVIAAEGVTQVVSPWTATLRFTGPFLDYGRIAVLEPAPGWLLILGGLDEVQRDPGEVVLRGEPVGRITQTRARVAGFALEPDPESSPNPKRLLYVELRRGGVPVDPASWFEVGP